MERAETEDNEALDEQELFYLLRDWLAHHDKQDAMLLLQAAEQMQEEHDSQTNTPRQHTEDAH